MFDAPSIYVSHPLRPNKYSREENIKIAYSCANRLRTLFPEINFYIPAEGEPIFQVVKDTALITENELIKQIDLKILERCQAHIILYWDSSHGCIMERNHSILLGIPYITIPWFINKASYTQVRRALTPIVERAIRDFRRRDDE